MPDACCELSGVDLLLQVLFQGSFCCSQKCIRWAFVHLNMASTGLQCRMQALQLATSSCGWLITGMHCRHLQHWSFISYNTSHLDVGQVNFACLCICPGDHSLPHCDHFCLQARSPADRGGDWLEEMPQVTRACLCA